MKSGPDLWASLGGNPLKGMNTYGWLLFIDAYLRAFVHSSCYVYCNKMLSDCFTNGGYP